MRVSQSAATVGDPVTLDYPSERPHRFPGGTLRRVAVDVHDRPHRFRAEDSVGALITQARTGAAVLLTSRPQNDE